MIKSKKNNGYLLLTLVSWLFAGFLFAQQPGNGAAAAAAAVSHGTKRKAQEGQENKQSSLKKRNCNSPSELRQLATGTLREMQLFLAVNRNELTDDNKFILFRNSVNAKRSDLVREYIIREFDVNCLDADNSSHLLIATENNDAEMVELLLKAGAQLDIRNIAKKIDSNLTNIKDRATDSAFKIALQKSDEKIVSIFMRYDAIMTLNLNEQKELFNSAQDRIKILWNSAMLKRGVSQKKYDLVTKILQRQPYTIDDTLDDGVTALMCAAYAGDEQMVQLLMDNNAQLLAYDIYGRSPISHAVLSASPNKKKIIRLLLSKPAYQDANGNTLFNYLRMLPYEYPEYELSLAHQLKLLQLNQASSKILEAENTINTAIQVLETPELNHINAESYEGMLEPIQKQKVRSYFLEKYKTLYSLVVFPESLNAHMSVSQIFVFLRFAQAITHGKTINEKFNIMPIYQLLATREDQPVKFKGYMYSSINKCLCFTLLTELYGLIGSIIPKELIELIAQYGKPVLHPLAVQPVMTSQIAARLAAISALGKYTAS